MARYRYHRSRYTYSRDIGRERALQHIEEYRRLEAELGSTVIEAVKQYLFSLPPHQLRVILDDYGQKYGRNARNYATEQKIREWQTRRVHMGGQTAARLFNLLPPRMPLPTKYQLVENLWNHVGPKSKKTLRVGLDANVEQVLEAVRKHLDGLVAHRISEELERQFNWLAARDSQVKQDLLNHLRQQYEKQLVAESARLQLPVMIEHLRSEAGQHTHRLAQVLKIGNHELEIALDKSASGVAIVEPLAARPAAAFTQAANYKWLWWVVAAIVVLFLMMRK
jgi:hypothetical protein